jgi:hypothetical protein
MIPLYRRVVARHQIGIVCISEARSSGLVTHHPRKTAMFKPYAEAHCSFISHRSRV